MMLAHARCTHRYGWWVEFTSPGSEVALCMQLVVPFYDESFGGFRTVCAMERPRVLDLGFGRSFLRPRTTALNNFFCVRSLRLGT